MEFFLAALLLCAAVSCAADTIPPVVPVPTVTSPVAPVPTPFVEPLVSRLIVFVPEDHAQDYSHHLASRILSKSKFRDLFLKDVHDTYRHFLTSPVVVVSKSHVIPGSFDINYLSKGLNSVAHDPAYNRLQSFLRTPTEKFGVLFDPTHYFHARLFDAPVSDFVIPSNYKLGDSAVEYPAFLFVADAPDFEKFDFSDIKEIAKFNILPNIVEPAH